MKEEESVTAMTDIRKRAKESCFVKWQRKWELTEAGIHLFNFRPTVKSKDKFVSHSKNQEILRQLNRHAIPNSINTTTKQTVKNHFIVYVEALKQLNST